LLYQSHMKASFFDQNFNEINAQFLEHNLHPSGASLLYNWHYKLKQFEPCKTDLALKTQSFLRENYDFTLPKIVVAKESEDRTVKFLFELHDGKRVETVLIPFIGKYSVCLSTQVGCAMKCSFCFTGTQGLTRHLTTSEIIGQYLGAWDWLRTHRPSELKIPNIVFMGQGEPLHNFDAVKKACEIFLTEEGMCLGSRRITVSTAGYLPGLLRWKDEMPQVNIALSLHSPFEEKRNKLIPINQRYPLHEIVEVLDQIPMRKKQFVTYEYLLIDHYNDFEEDAHATGELLKSRRALLNLIPFNPFPGSEFKRPSFERVEAFKKITESYKVPSMIRGTKGDDILAACGQLNTK